MVWAEHPGWGDPLDPESLAHEVLVQDAFEALTAGMVAEAREAAVAAEAARPRGEVLGEALGQAAGGMARAGEVLGEVARVASGDLGGALGRVGALGGQVEASLFSIAAEAHQRGLHHEGGFSLVDWMAQAVPWADRVLLGRVATVAAACNLHRQNAPIAAAVSAGAFPVRRAAVICEALGKVRGVLDADQYGAYVDILTDAAANPDLSDLQLRRATERLLELVLDRPQRERAERAAHAQRGVAVLRRSGGMTRFVIDAPPGQAAMITGALTSRLAAPTPGPEGEPDERSATQRRFDAFVTVFSRGLSCPQGTPQIARATLFVTMDLDDLREDTPGHGVSLGGDLLSAAQVRQAACEAEVIPVILGGESQVLDLGRARRLASPEQVKALYLRDGGCTFPGCTVPAQWTIAHHDPWWSHGGATDLDKLALLCERHHTHVHQNDLRASIDATGVTWHLR
ncbi:hypothetical protein GCM10011509_15200 [Ornithinimicrobium pekingense]|uniref:HNH nuclease domain-containing protein n=1 Tax=Ornithinimicrobium pekingense TaxID=384677 RepID=A0ABQ2F7N5_9MICO|nr:hypothetical protein GCM10011509_15200 [Ornithinimicrobium pekingense]